MAAYVEMTLFWAAGDVGKLLTTRYNTTDDNTLRFQIALRCVSRPLREEEHSDKTVSGATPWQNYWQGNAGVGYPNINLAVTKFHASRS
jgi:hypothetical protein